MGRSKGKWSEATHIARDVPWRQAYILERGFEPRRTVGLTKIDRGWPSNVVGFSPSGKLYEFQVIWAYPKYYLNDWFRLDLKKRRADGQNIFLIRPNDPGGRMYQVGGVNFPWPASNWQCFLDILSYGGQDILVSWEADGVSPYRVSLKNDEGSRDESTSV